jgi:hypothetical protein
MLKVGIATWNDVTFHRPNALDSRLHTVSLLLLRRTNAMPACCSTIQHRTNAMPACCSTIQHATHPAALQRRQLQSLGDKRRRVEVDGGFFWIRVVVDVIFMVEPRGMIPHNNAASAAEPPDHPCMRMSCSKTYATTTSRSEQEHGCSP